MNVPAATIRVPLERPALADPGRGSAGATGRAQPAAGERFSALLDTPAHHAPAVRTEPAHTDAGTRFETLHRESSPATAPAPPAAAGHGSPAADTVLPPIVHTAAAAGRDDHRSKDAPSTPKPTTAEDDIAGLLDDVADWVNVHRHGRAAHWSVSVWLREAVLRDTQLAMAGQPGRVDIRFSTTDSDSLRRLHAGHEELQARLQERIAVPHLQVAIESVHPAAGAGDRQPAGELGDPV